ncbi:MAG: NAD(P)-binding domain-containing protein, partial [Clostridia bacterium]|nr:NAD(P)-binding domain-containing protein [Clostridia bacterium]
MYDILVTSKSFARYNPELIDTLKGNGINIIRASKSNMSAEDIAQIIPQYDGIICGIDSINKGVIQAGDKLKIIHMHGTGVDHIDIDEANIKGVYVGNCPGANATAVAELNLAILLAEARGVVKHSKSIYEKKWERNLGVELSNKVMGVIGLGYIGRKFVELLRGFNMRVIAYEPYPNLDWVQKNNVELLEDINQVFSESDFISLNLPLIESTMNIINKDTIALMKKDVIIVNTSRGGLINTNDLVDAIKNKTIKGAALDAFTNEPIHWDSELLNIDLT